MSDLEQSFEWEPAKNAFRLVPNPIDWDAADSIDMAIMESGYTPEMSSDFEKDLIHPTVTLYATEKPGLPRFYIDIMGRNTQLATLVAKDFLSLLETFKQLHPLLTMMGLEQTVSAVISSEITQREIHNLPY